MHCGEHQQRRTETVVGVVVTIVVVRVERTRVTIVRIATTVEPRIAGIHEVRVRPALRSWGAVPVALRVGEPLPAGCSTIGR